MALGINEVAAIAGSFIGLVDLRGNGLFAVGLTALLVGIAYGVQPYGGHAMGWSRC